WEYLYQTVDTTFDIAYHGKLFSPPPPQVNRTNGTLDVVFQNPIAKAQRSGEAEAVLLTMNDLAPLGQQFPQMFDRVDPDELALGVMTIRGLPAKWMRNDKEMKSLRDEKQKHDQAQIQQD